MNALLAFSEWKNVIGITSELVQIGHSVTLVQNATELCEALSAATFDFVVADSAGSIELAEEARKLLSIFGREVTVATARFAAGSVSFSVSEGHFVSESIIAADLSAQLKLAFAFAHIPPCGSAPSFAQAR